MKKMQDIGKWPGLRLPGMVLCAMAALPIPSGRVMAEDAVVPMQPEALASGFPVNPQALDSKVVANRLLKALEKMHRDGSLPPQATLLEQLKRTSCQLRLPTGKDAPLASPALYETARKSVMVVACVTDKLGSPGKKSYQMNAGTGYMITESGVMVTNHHIIADKLAVGTAAMDASGRLHAVREVLAANPEHDIAIVRIDGSGFTPLSLNATAPIGTDVSIVAHPDGKYFTMSRGMVTGYPIMQNQGALAQMMYVSSQYCGGASGGPILNDHCEVVGMVSSLKLVVKPSKTGQPVPQMVFHYGPPAAAILSMIQPPDS